MLDPIAPDVYAATGGTTMPGGLHFPCRMTVLRLPDSGLVLHSPVAIDDALAAEIDALGPVAHLIAPNVLHHTFFGDAAARYPDATPWGAPGLAEKRPDLRFARTLGEDPLPFVEALEGLAIDGIPFLNETVFFHHPSGTLLVTDLFFHMLDRPPNWMSRTVFSLLGVLGRPRQSPLVRMQTQDRAAAAASVRRLLDWPIQRVAPAHGAILEGDGVQGTVAEVLDTMAGWGAA